MRRNITTALLLCATLIFVGEIACAADVSFQGRVYRVSQVRPKDESGNILSVAALNRRDLIFVHLEDGRKFLHLTEANVKGTFTKIGNESVERHVFLTLNLTDGTIDLRTSIKGRLLFLDGATANASPLATPLLKAYRIPLDVFVHAQPTDVCVIDKDLLGLRTDGTKHGDERVYIITRREVSHIHEDTWFNHTLYDADRPNYSAAFIEYDSHNENFLLSQPNLSADYNMDVRDRLTAWRWNAESSHVGALVGALYFTENTAFDYTYDGTPISYGDVALGVTFDPETGVIYQLDAGSRTIYVLTPLSPTLNSINPASGTTKGGTDVVLQGSLFPNDALVYFNGIPATEIQVASSTRIRAKTPPHAAGAADVTVVGTNIPWNEPLRLTAGYLYANTPPIAKLSASPTSGPPPLLVQLSAAGSGDPDGSLVSRIIYFGDGGSYVFSSPTSSSAMHTYAERGVYTATLTVTDDEGASSSDTAKIYVGTGGDDWSDEAGLNGVSIAVGLADDSGARDRMSVKGSFLLPPDEDDLKEAEVEIGVGGVEWKLTLDEKERYREKDVSMTLKRVKNRFITAGTYVFSFRGKGVSLKEGLEAAGMDLSQDGIAATEAYVRFTNVRGRVLIYVKRMVVEIRSRNGKNATVRRR